MSNHFETLKKFNLTVETIFNFNKSQFMSIDNDYTDFDSNIIEDVYSDLIMDNIIVLEHDNIKEVVSGKLLYNNIIKFMNNEFGLGNCSWVPELSGKDYERLDDKFKSIFGSRGINVFIYSFDDSDSMLNFKKRVSNSRK